MSIFDRRVGTCGCCDPRSPGTPEPIHNRPALDAITYRVGTWASFRQSMVDLVPVLADEVARAEGLATRPLERWTSRRSDDYGIALFEMWATVADVLTFYQERYANRAWLRTAVERDAVRRLAALLGYRLKPGVAADAHLAIELDADATLTVPVGLRAQSVPADGQQPQTFETDDAVDATAALNRVRVYGAPEDVTPLAVGRTHATVADGSVVPLAGDAVLLWTDDGATVEHRTVAAVDVVDGRSVVRWSRPLAHAHAHASLWARSHRAFGHSAPETWLEQTAILPGGGVDPTPTPIPSRIVVDQQTTNFVTWKTRTTTFDFEDAGTVHLDGTVDGIEAGSDVLIVAAGVAHLRTVQSVSPTTFTVGPTTGAATALELDTAITHDVRSTVVYELTADVVFQEWELPDAPLPAGTTTVYAPYPEVTAIAAGRVLVLDDDAGQPLLTAADGDAEPDGSGDEREFLAVSLASPTTRELDHRSAVLLGNVAPASHGETVAGEVLGDGAAAVALQEFAVAKSPVTHVTDPTAPGGARSTLAVSVDGVRWTQRAHLLGAGPHERIYTTAIDDDATTTVRFGDGVTGARLSTGRGNVVAGYRVGLGVDGNLDAGQIATALDRPTGLRGVHNPLPSTGGVEPETAAGARENAPNTVRTFDRAVSLRDFADLAREYAGVAKALATWVWDGEERVVHVTIGGEDAAPLDAALVDLRAYLDLRRDPNRALRVAEYRSVPFVVAVTVEVDAAYRNDDVAGGVTAAVERYFAYDERSFGQAVHLSDIYEVIHTVDGVESALVTELDYGDAGDRATHPAPSAPTPYSGGGVATGSTFPRGTRRRPGGRTPGSGASRSVVHGRVFFPPRVPTVVLHAPIAGARHDPVTGDIAPAELAELAAADLTVTATGGIAS